MEFFKDVANAIFSAKDFVVEKNRKTALINRLRTVVKCEEQSAERAYLALGRYYYHNLRNASDPVTEPHCADVEASEKRLEQAISHLEKIYNDQESDSIVEVIDLDDVIEIAPEDDIATEDVLDEAVEAVKEETAKYGENESLPFES